MRQRLSGHVRAFLKCFFAIVVASSAVVLAISNFASAYRQGKQWVMWIAHFASGAGRPYVVLIALGLGVVGAAFISSHIHLRHKIPHAKNRLLGGGAVSLGLALLLAIDAHVGRPHTSGTESAQPRIARVLPQPGSAEEQPAAPPARESTQGTNTQVGASDRENANQPAPTDASYQQTGSEPSAQEAVMSTYSPGYSEAAGQEEDGQTEQSESEESAPEESGPVSTTSSTVESSNAPTSSTSTSVSISATASSVVYSRSETTSTSSNETTSEPQGTETSEPSSEGGAMEGGCSGE